MSDWSDIIWIISSASSSQGDNCVEVAFVDDEVLVRNSKDRTGTMAKFTASEWDAFVTGAKNGEFDRGK